MSDDARKVAAIFARKVFVSFCVFYTLFAAFRGFP